MKTRVALATVSESREDFYRRRKIYFEEQNQSIEWLRRTFDCCESEAINSHAQVNVFVQRAQAFRAQALVVHIPIWSDPVFSVELATRLKLPVLLLGNDHPSTSSIVGVLGAGGALDQVGYAHKRVFQHGDTRSQAQVNAYLNAAGVLANLRGKRLGLFGGRSLGILTAVADPAQWLRLFGVDIEYFDQLEIVRLAQSLAAETVQSSMDWMAESLSGIHLSGSFNQQAFERQVRSYLATRLLAERNQLDFVGVKCQPELSDGYATQCVAHLLSNGVIDADGEKPILVHACESDADGALTMQILHMVSGGKPAALLDVRWYDVKRRLWTLANCGAIPAAFFTTQQDVSGLKSLHMEAHVFGLGGGGALPGVVAPQPVTLARLCRRNGEYWMAILSGEIVENPGLEVEASTPVFPKAFVRTAAGADFLDVYGSNHIHMVSGDYVEDLIALCKLADIDMRVWQN
jgi:L-fucose isomerase